MRRPGGPPLLTLALATPAAAASIQQEQLDKLWAKDAVRFNEKPKMGCVCFDGSNNYRLGHVIQYDSSRAPCYFTSFNADGSVSAQSPCLGSFTPLTRHGPVNIFADCGRAR